MKVEVVRVASVFAAERLDARYHLSPGVKASELIEIARAKELPVKRLGGPTGLGKVWRPLRFRRAYAVAGEPSAPYLRPYDVFEYMPVAADHLSLVRNKRIDSYRLSRGMILQTCSGRNLGPAVAVDGYLATFLAGDDIVRIEVGDERLRHYVLAFLQSEVGQHLLKRGKTGSVIDHISDAHIASIEVPMFSGKTINAVAKAMRSAVDRREKARLRLGQLLAQYEGKLPKIARTTPSQAGWTRRAKSIDDRLDAAFYDPLVEKIRAELRKLGGLRVKDVGEVLKPAGRYKTYYVDKDYGRPILSGTQVLQAYAVNLQYISPRALKNVSPYELRRGWIVYPADGRAEEALGLPAIVTSNRDGWLASGHVGRIVPKKSTSAGWLWLACRTEHAQLQIKAASSGSVVDSTFPGDMENVVLPPPLGTGFPEVETMWETFVQAEQDEAHAKAIIQAECERLTD